MPSPDTPRRSAPALSFEQLGTRIESLASQREQGGFGWAGAALLGAVGMPFLLIAASLFLAEDARRTAVWIGVVLQWVIVFAVLATGARRLWRRYRAAHVQLAASLDADLHLHRALIAWLREFDANSLRELRGYVAMRRRILKSRLGLVIGGFDKFGLLPMVVAIYLQFKDVSVHHLERLPDVSLAGVLLLALAATLYGVSWWHVRLGSRLEVYEILLGDALGERDEPSHVIVEEG
jgi:hypothetical protein